eukprot:1363880-Ditylum_brightwellii.AAC.1
MAVHTAIIGQPETKWLIEITLAQEAAFESELERKHWYNTHDLSQQETKDEFKLRKVPIVYCPPEWIFIVSLHLLCSFSKNQPKHYHTEGTELRFVAIPGALVVYKSKKRFSAHLATTAKMATCIQNMVGIPGFNSALFFYLLSLDPANLFNNITPHTSLMVMPQSDTDPLPAFFQVRRVKKEKDIQAMCIPSLPSIAALY